MKKDEIIQQLIDFCEGKGKFIKREEYRGMDGSSIPDLYIKYFRRLKPSEKKEAALIMVAGAIGEIDVLTPFIWQIIFLIEELCLNTYVDYFKDSIEIMEEEFNNSANLELWANADVPMIPYQGVSFKKEWSYSKSLWAILYMLKSDKIDESYRYLVNNSKSEDFRRALINSKRDYDKYAKITYNRKKKK